MSTQLTETMVDRRVTYTLEKNGRFFVIENVPARVCVETSEQYFAPETVEQLQQTIWEEKEPKRMIETPAYEFAA